MYKLYCEEYKTPGGRINKLTAKCQARCTICGLHSGYEISADMSLPKNRKEITVEGLQLWLFREVLKDNKYINNGELAHRECLNLRYIKELGLTTT